MKSWRFSGCARPGAVPVIRKILFVLPAFGFGRVLFKVTPDMGCGVFGVAGAEFFGESGVDQAVEFLDRIGLFVFQQRADGMIDRGRPFEDGIFVAAPLFFQQHRSLRGCGRVLAFDGGQIFVLHFQHDVDLFVLQLFVESQESLQAGSYRCGRRAVCRAPVGNNGFSACRLLSFQVILASAIQYWSCAS